MMSLYSGNFQKILVIQTASIGDVILATPVIEKLHANYPGAQIDFLLKEGFEDLLGGHPYVRAILSWNKNESKYTNLYNLLEFIRSERYDVVINLQRFLSTGILTAFSGAKVKLGFKKNPLSFLFTKSFKHKIGEKYGNVHEIDRNLSLTSFIKDNKRYRPGLYPGKKAEARISQYKTRSYITISPASIWYTKQFPEKKWMAFLDKIPRDFNVFFLGAKEDKELSERIIKASSHPHVMDLCGKLSLLESASLIADAHMNFANDSAAQHLASAMNAPITTIYCSTVPEFGFGPLSDDSAVIETDEDLYCRPCGLHGYNKCPEGHFKCADIDIEKLLNRLD